jgi:hypothetical protein
MPRKTPRKVDGNRPIERGHIDLVDSTDRAGIAGIVEMTVESPEAVHRRRHGGVDVLFLGHVRMHKARSLAKFIGDSLSTIIVNVGYED